MAEIFTLVTLFLALAVISTIVANHLRISMALVEICIGVLAGAELEPRSSPR